MAHLDPWLDRSTGPCVVYGLEHVTFVVAPTAVVPLTTYVDVN
jgi:hypothetical protein